ncbi:MAG: tripartite tricarboxylate transporter TctB family protein [Syntrophorhabdaceae bacterium]|nr:tripartite tricarboxylate transporter TctB family protein [Syntrophorhabdaceae bacterium]
MEKSDRWSALFWLLFSIFIAYESFKMGLGQVNQPGPGFLFFWTSIFIAILSLIVMAKTFGRKSSKDTKEKGKAEGTSNWTKLISVLIALFLYAFFMERLGFIIVTFLLFLFLLGFIERKRWWYALLLSVLVAVLSYLLFETGLKSQLPKGILESLMYKF